MVIRGESCSVWVAEAPICSLREGWAEGGIPHEHTRDQSTWNFEGTSEATGSCKAVRVFSKAQERGTSQVLAYRCGEGSQDKGGSKTPQSWLI